MESPFEKGKKQHKLDLEKRLTELSELNPGDEVLAEITDA